MSRHLFKKKKKINTNFPRKRVVSRTGQAPGWHGTEEEEENLFRLNGTAEQE